MSKTKDYIDKMKDAGIDVLANENEYVENETYEKMLEVFKAMNELFVEKAKTDKND